MIIYTKEESRMVSTLTNVMTLAVPEGGYIYVDKSTYEQATVLNTKFGTSMNDLAQLIGTTYHAEQITKFWQIMPEPIRVLAPFFGILDPAIQFSGDTEELVGCMHVISESLDFWKYIKLPRDVRRNVTFSDHIKYEYQVAYEKFRTESISYDKLVEIFRQSGTFYEQPQAQPAPIFQQPTNLFQQPTPVYQQPMFQQPAPAPAPVFQQPAPAPAPVFQQSAPAKAPAKAPDLFPTTNITIKPENANDPALQAIASDPVLMQKLFGEEDLESEEFQKALAETRKLDEDRALNGVASANVTPTTIDEAKSGKSLLSQWDL